MADPTEELPDSEQPDGGGETVEELRFFNEAQQAREKGEIDKAEKLENKAVEALKASLSQIAGRYEKQPGAEHLAEHISAVLDKMADMEEGVEELTPAEVAEPKQSLNDLIVTAKDAIEFGGYPKGKDYIKALGHFQEMLKRDQGETSKFTVEDLQKMDFEEVFKDKETARQIFNQIMAELSSESEAIPSEGIEDFDNLASEMAKITRLQVRIGSKEFNQLPGGMQDVIKEIAETLDGENYQEILEVIGKWGEKHQGQELTDSQQAELMGMMAARDKHLDKNLEKYGGSFQIGKPSIEHTETLLGAKTKLINELKQLKGQGETEDNVNKIRELSQLNDTIDYAKDLGIFSDETSAKTALRNINQPEQPPEPSEAEKYWQKIYESADDETRALFDTVIQPATDEQAEQTLGTLYQKVLAEYLVSKTYTDENAKPKMNFTAAFRILNQLTTKQNQLPESERDKFQQTIDQWEQYTKQLATEASLEGAADKPDGSTETTADNGLSQLAELLGGRTLLHPDYITNKDGFREKFFAEQKQELINLLSQMGRMDRELSDIDQATRAMASSIIRTFTLTSTQRQQLKDSPGYPGLQADLARHNAELSHLEQLVTKSINIAYTAERANNFEQYTKIYDIANFDQIGEIFGEEFKLKSGETVKVADSLFELQDMLEIHSKFQDLALRLKDDKKDTKAAIVSGLAGEVQAAIQAFGKGNIYTFKFDQFYTQVNGEKELDETKIDAWMKNFDKTLDRMAAGKAGDEFKLKAQNKDDFQALKNDVKTVQKKMAAEGLVLDSKANFDEEKGFINRLAAVGAEYLGIPASYKVNMFSASNFHTRLIHIADTAAAYEKEYEGKTDFLVKDLGLFPAFSQKGDMGPLSHYGLQIPIMPDGSENKKYTAIKESIGLEAKPHTLGKGDTKVKITRTRFKREKYTAADGTVKYRMERLKQVPDEFGIPSGQAGIHIADRMKKVEQFRGLLDAYFREPSLDTAIKLTQNMGWTLRTEQDFQEELRRKIVGKNLELTLENYSFKRPFNFGRKLDPIKHEYIDSQGRKRTVTEWRRKQPRSQSEDMYGDDGAVRSLKETLQLVGKLRSDDVITTKEAKILEKELTQMKVFGVEIPSELVPSANLRATLIEVFNRENMVKAGPKAVYALSALFVLIGVPYVAKVLWQMVKEGLGETSAQIKFA